MVIQKFTYDKDIVNYKKSPPKTLDSRIVFSGRYFLQVTFHRSLDIGQKQYKNSLHSANGTRLALKCIQLFRERLSYKRGNAYTTMSKVIIGNGDFTVAWLKLKVFHSPNKSIHAFYSF